MGSDKEDTEGKREFGWLSPCISTSIPGTR
jgi:hypothetical protein